MGYIELNNVTYTYPLADEPSIANVSVTLERGHFYTIIGANGSGKTTLCNIIRGFVPNFFQGNLTGDITFDGKSLSDYTMGDLSQRMGYVFQNPFNQITGARDTVYGEIAYGLENFGVAVPEMRERVERIMEMTNTVFLKDKNPFELSGGQQQRVALASVLVLDPDVLVIDEPTSQLDPKETERVFGIISQLKDMGKTIILVEHKMELVAQYSDEVLVLDNGRLIRVGEEHEVLSDISLAKHGVMLPRTVLLAQELRSRGFNIRSGVVTVEELAQELEPYANRFRHTDAGFSQNRDDQGCV